MNGIAINDPSTLRFVKRSRWSVKFEVDGKRYMLHESTEDCETSVTLYRLFQDRSGRFDLDEIATARFDGIGVALRGAGMSEVSDATPLSQISKTWFLATLHAKGLVRL